jgi:hypothetical protein
MQENNKAVTSLVRSMKRALKAQHGIDVPHSALRASYLQALGENPHAFAGRSAAAPTAATAAVTQAPSHAAKRLRTLYLVGDELGCLERFALDQDGSAVLPDDFTFRDTRLERQYAELPRVAKYGLPDYLAKASTFYAQFGIKLANTYEHDYRDLGDDSGDACRLFVSMPDEAWEHLLAVALEENTDFDDAVAEWVGLHHGRNFDKMARAEQLDWVQRYLDSLEPQPDMDDDPRDVEEPEAPGLEVFFEYVYPDEDGDSVPALLDTATGLVSLATAIPADVASPNVRTRIWVSDDGTRLDSAGDGAEFKVRYYRNAHGGGIWMVGYEALERIRAYPAPVVKN